MRCLDTSLQTYAVKTHTASFLELFQRKSIPNLIMCVMKLKIVQDRLYIQHCLLPFKCVMNSHLAVCCKMAP